MQAIGYGEFRPKVSNNNAKGRSENRRVVLVILGSDNTRKVIKSDPKNTKKLKQIESNPENFNAKSSPMISF